MNDARGVECQWSDLGKHPHCPHGPTLLFGRYVNGESERFYACSACRDRKLCRFYLKYGQELSESQRSTWEQERRTLARRYPHQKLYIRFHEIRAESAARRRYCHDCEKLFLSSVRDEHNGHEVTENLTDRQMDHPTELLKPLGNAKKEAQYLFSKKSTEDVTSMLLKLGAKQVLCIGTPRLHEYICERHTDKMSSLLLDLDGRFHNFFGPLDYCWYNLFNHHFFNEDAVSVFRDFLTQNQGRDTYLICDPPFGGRVEPMSYTIKLIFDLHRKLNDNDNVTLRIMFMFPYFMERIMREKSNPPSVGGGLRDLKMSDYKVDYDNHPLFVPPSEARGGARRRGTPVRIFTNIPLRLLELPASDGYRFCERCERWVAGENRHCERCDACTSKDGRRYRHCELCGRCVKPTWRHCETCGRCALAAGHACGRAPSVVGRCFGCNELGHTSKECPDASSVKTETDVKGGGETVEKRKAKKSGLKASLIKKGRIEGPEKSAKRETPVVGEKRKASRNLRKHRGNKKPKTVESK